ncbi:hypothetical protein [Ruegeria atlantica]|uniref:hypothetical protein n=1 Tax=Ruegeria atlantica TaxID=81569 RepID=UPI00148181BB|nr:hypothetical protein [Ruegeria atlantica]
MQVAIHAGVAFTDEGRVLNSLKKNSDILAANGASFFGPRRFKTSFKPVLDELKSEDAETAARQYLRDILPTGPRARRTIFTSQDFAAEPAFALQEGLLYPLAGRRMAMLEQIYHEHEIELFIGLRSPGSFIPKLLMALPEQTRTEIMQTTDLSCLSWIGMVEDIRELAPGIQITLWSNEDTPFIWGDIIRALAGLEEDTALVDEHDLLLSLLDDAGRNKLQELTNSHAPQAKDRIKDDIARIFEDHARPEKIEEELELPGWNTEIVDAFSELYEQDLDRLGEIPGVRVLTP